MSMRYESNENISLPYDTSVADHTSNFIGSNMTMSFEDDTSPLLHKTGRKNRLTATETHHIIKIKQGSTESPQRHENQSTNKVINDARQAVKMRRDTQEKIKRYDSKTAVDEISGGKTEYPNDKIQSKSVLKSSSTRGRTIKRESNVTRLFRSLSRLKTHDGKKDPQGTKHIRLSRSKSRLDESSIGSVSTNGSKRKKFLANLGGSFRRSTGSMTSRESRSRRSRKWSRRKRRSRSRTQEPSPSPESSPQLQDRVMIIKQSSPIDVMSFPEESKHKVSVDNAEEKSTWDSVCGVLSPYISVCGEFFCADDQASQDKALIGKVIGSESSRDQSTTI